MRDSLGQRLQRRLLRVAGPPGFLLALACGGSDERVPGGPGDDFDALPVFIELSRDGDTVDTLGFSTSLFRGVGGTQGGSSWLVAAPQPYAEDAFLFRTADGRAYYGLERPASDQEGLAEFTVRKHARGGEQAWIRTYRYRPVETRPEVADSAMAMALSSAPAGVSLPELAVRLRRLVDVPRFQPPVRQLRVNRDGSLWLQREYDPSGARWTLLGADGAPTATLLLPPGLTPSLITDEYVYGWRRDAGSQPHLIRYRVSRP